DLDDPGPGLGAIEVERQVHRGTLIPKAGPFAALRMTSGSLLRKRGGLALHDLSEQLRQADLEWRDVRTWTPGEGHTQDFRPRFPWAPALDNASRDVHDPVVRDADALEQLPLHRSIGARGAGRQDLDGQEQAFDVGPALGPAPLHSRRDED